jgi:hypothetical protein
MSSHTEKDLEKNPESGIAYDARRHSYVDETGAVPGESFEYGDSYYAKIQRLAGKFSIEQRGIERVPENERTEEGFMALMNVGTMVSSNIELEKVYEESNFSDSGSLPTWSSLPSPSACLENLSFSSALSMPSS